MARVTPSSPLPAQLLEVRPLMAHILPRGRRPDAHTPDKVQRCSHGVSPGSRPTRPTRTASAHGPPASRPTFVARRVAVSDANASSSVPDFGDAAGTSAPGSSPEEGAALSEARRALVAAMEQLSDAQFVVLVLVDVYGFSCAETAEKLGIPLGTAKSRYAAAHAHMRCALGPKERYISVVQLPEGERRKVRKDLETRTTPDPRLRRRSNPPRRGVVLRRPRHSSRDAGPCISL